jgi:thiol-disulfide isomerase/thioredoxin
MYPNNLLVQNLHSNVEKMGKQIELYVKRNDMFEVDSILPNVSFPLLNGEFRNIMQIGWRYTLIDFWATWCNTCGSVSKGYKPIYQKYKSKGFEILQFSLDDSREELLKAVERDSLVWLHAFDSLGWHSPIVDSLRVNAIPANYLIDRKGVVKAKNLSVQELNDMLEKLFP